MFMQVNGDSGNDEELFDVEHVKGCIVANAKFELLRYAEANSHKQNIYKVIFP
jgi:hydroxymethylpyrimidine pyrophosphatase-like HAD family hydrolase